MKYIKGAYNEKMSKIGLGTARFGTRVSKGESFELLDRFYNAGGTVLDTARNYYDWVENGRGASEKCIGEWLEGKEREKMIIATKGGVINRGREYICDLSKENLLNEIKQSLESLRTDYIDIYLLHRDEKERPVEEIVETMQEIKDFANVGYIGVANWSIQRIIQANEYAEKNKMVPFQIIQTWWSLAEYTDSMWDDPTTTHMDDDTYEYMLKNNIIGMAYTSQCKGFFQKAITNGLENIDSFLQKRIVTPTNLKKLDYIKKYCEENKISPTAFVTGYITSNKNKGIALVSVSNQTQLDDILKWSDYNLPLNIIEEIDKIKG